MKDFKDYLIEEKYSDDPNMDRSIRDFITNNGADKVVKLLKKYGAHDAKIEASDNGGRSFNVYFVFNRQGTIFDPFYGQIKLINNASNFSKFILDVDVKIALYKDIREADKVITHLKKTVLNIEKAVKFIEELEEISDLWTK